MKIYRNSENIERDLKILNLERQIAWEEIKAVKEEYKEDFRPYNWIQSGLKIAALILHEGIHAEIHGFVSRYEAGVEPNNRPRLFKLYAHYKGWAEKYQDEDYNWKQDAHHNYMVENYVTQIASAIRQIDNNKYPLSYYMAYGWDGLTKYGYTAKRLSISQNKTNQELRRIVEQKTQICK